MNIRDVLKSYERTVIIVHYKAFDVAPPGTYNGGPPPQNPACLVQIALLADKVSASGNLIRLGETQGDEIMGWTKLDALEVVEILGELSIEGTKVTPIVQRETLALPNSG